ncbi:MULTISPECIES: cation:proton antiporter regulatory subunit [Haloferax]|uniref:Cation:proton antiporter regulatory subunit n=2 Tax=Haloferax volcanii TaxID=2246 RepID=A0A6C0UMK7_HALVO|nr:MULTISPECIES: TrkA C-terminal domain-containing protein [Haloferax]ELK54055.1 TrkA-C domain-containing protein [Haloferax sp. BAB-2207]ELZ90810.1 TrkA-C domain-containing protein [Haloferax alexandrinus JCM 10717]MBC9984879.1 potassium transporter TrkA [Haloferax sp. AS1]NLV01092.1 potassium transporter TrkA [Haloferax alexandrinus]QIB76726.1 cation:proton antiporter regulatory subunit [Haloferax alexandrinus]
MTVYESDLPGVGKKHEVDLGDGSRLVIVTHNSGKREVFRRASADSDSEKLFELTDKLARQVGTLLEGAYFQPVQTETIETLLGDNTLIEWVEVGANSDIAGKTLGESDLRQATGASVIAIERGDEVVTSPGGDAMVEAGDTLVVIGPKTACRDFVALVKGA